MGVPNTVELKDNPAPSVDAVRALLPSYAQQGDDSIMRAAVLAAWVAVVTLLWDRAGRVLSAQITPRFADGKYLDAWASIMGRWRVPSEDDAAYRQRLLTPEDLVTGPAIKAAVNAVVAQYTADAVVYQEPMFDAMFTGPATATDPVRPGSNVVSHTVPSWQAFIQAPTKRLWANYPDHPGAKTGAYVVPWPSGARFWVTLPGYPGSASLVMVDQACSEIEHRKAAGVLSYLLIDPYFTGGL